MGTFVSISSHCIFNELCVWQTLWTIWGRSHVTFLWVHTLQTLSSIFFFAKPLNIVLMTPSHSSCYQSGLYSSKVYIVLRTVLILLWKELHSPVCGTLFPLTYNCSRPFKLSLGRVVHVRTWICGNLSCLHQCNSYCVLFLKSLISMFALVLLQRLHKKIPDFSQARPIYPIKNKLDLKGVAWNRDLREDSAENIPLFENLTM